MVIEVFRIPLEWQDLGLDEVPRASAQSFKFRREREIHV